MVEKFLETPVHKHQVDSKHPQSVVDCHQCEWALEWEALEQETLEYETLEWAQEWVLEQAHEEHQCVEEKKYVVQKEFQWVVQVVVQIQDDLQLVHPQQVQKQKVDLHEHELVEPL